VTGASLREGDDGLGGASRWVVLALLSVAVLAAMSPWFTASAAAGFFRAEHGLGTGRLAWLTGAVQVGFVAGTLVAAILNLADLVPARIYFPLSALLAAGANALILLAPGYEELMLLRFATGFFLAGVYPPAMKMAATWFRGARGMAIGTVVGALTVGKAAPFLLRAGGGDDAVPVILGASVAGLAGAVLILVLYRDGPFSFPRRPFRWDLVGRVLAHRPTRLAIWGYLGHMWELYAVWSAIGLFFAAHFVGRVADPEGAGAMVAFWVIAVGGVGAVVAGVWADRWGRERVAAGALWVSGAVALGIGWLVHAPTWLLVGLALVWGITVVADSAQFSALVTEVSMPHAAGTALTLQTSMGFLLTTVTIQAVPWIAESWGWGPAFALLVPGPLFGIWAMARLKALRAGPTTGDPPTAGVATPRSGGPAPPGA
jgi:MFS family permease